MKVHQKAPALRLGLCCTFKEAPIKFRQSTARHLATLAPAPRARFVADICDDNANALLAALNWCERNGVGAFRILSQFFPLYTHPDVGYRWQDLPGAVGLEAKLTHVKQKAKAADIRLSFHPDQFVVPGSPTAPTAAASLVEIEYQAEVARLVGATQITLHGGGAQEGKPAALDRLRRGLDKLSPAARRLVVLENDDRVYTPEDLLPLCRSEGIRLVYDVHHHRCLPDGLSEDEATAAASETWGLEEPWFHVSSPAEGWKGRNPRAHHDRVWLRDLPAAWRHMRATVDVEAKGKEQSVLLLQSALANG